MQVGIQVDHVDLVRVYCPGGGFSHQPFFLLAALVLCFLPAGKLRLSSRGYSGLEQGPEPRSCLYHRIAAALFGHTERYAE